MNQFLSPEEVAALLQGMAEAEASRQERKQAKKSKPPETPYHAKGDRKMHRYYLADSPR